MFCKVILLFLCSALEWKLSTEHHFTQRKSLSTRKGIKSSDLMASRKLQTTRDNPPLQLWFCFPGALTDSFGAAIVSSPCQSRLLWLLECGNGDRERTICDKNSSLCYTSWHFPGQMYYSALQISNHVANCYLFGETEHPGMYGRLNVIQDPVTFCAYWDRTYHLCMLTYRGGGGLKNGWFAEPTKFLNVFSNIPSVK